MEKIILLIFIALSTSIYSEENIKTENIVKENNIAVTKQEVNEKNLEKPARFIVEKITEQSQSIATEIVKEEVKPEPNIEFEILTEYKNLERENLKFDIGLKGFERKFDNFIFIRNNANIRVLPEIKSKKITQVKRNRRLELLEAVQNNKKEIWYKIRLNDGKEGYIYARLANKRNFAYEKAIADIEKLNKFIEVNMEKKEELPVGLEIENVEANVEGIVQNNPEEIIINGVKQEITEKNIEEIKQKIIEETKKEIIKEKKEKEKSITEGIKVLSKYIPLDNSESEKVDSKGNYANQSVTVYTSEARKKHYNLPDGSLLKVIGETAKYYIITSPYYEEKLYYPKYLRRFIKNTNIEDKIKKFIYVSERDQNQITFELDEDNNYIVKLISDVTTGRKSKYGFKTPNGYFLVSIVRPFMKYVDNEPKKKLDEEGNEIIDKDKKPEIIGEAKIAIRFTGGAYLHGLPYKLEPKKTIERRKKSVKALLGTYPRSLKCIRNFDEVVEYQSNWIKYKSQDRYGNKKPEEAVIVIIAK